MSGIIDYLVDGMLYVVCAMISAFLYFCYSILVVIFAIIPSGWAAKLGSGLTYALKYWLWVENWIPLNLAVSLAGTYYAFLLASRVMQWAIKLLRG